MRETLHQKWRTGTLPALALFAVHFASLIVMNYAPKDSRWPISKGRCC